MRKMIFTATILLGGITSVAAQTENQPKLQEQPQTTVEAKAESRLIVANKAKASTVAKVEQDYKEVKSSDLPDAVKETIAKDFDGTTISKAYVNAQGEYKIELASKNAKKATVHVDSRGKLIKNELKKQ